MKSNTKISIVLVSVFVVLATLLLILQKPAEPVGSNNATGTNTPASSAAELVRPNSHRLTDVANSKVTVVEFLDLECEACLAAYPAVEQLRAEYGDRVTFVMRYFPISSHQNAELAARAVEAAGQQGQLEAMYQLMYQTQTQWGDQNVSHRDTFLGFAEQLGLDLPTFEQALDAQATIDRVRADQADGIALGVQGTPTFFINETQYTDRPTYEALKAVIDLELAK